MSIRLFFDALALLAGGMAGTLLRYEITHIWLSHLKCFMIPWPTLIVNSIGSFLIGTLFELFKKTGVVLPHAEKFLFIGFLGAFTTFSTYGLESINLLREGRYKQALIYVSLSNIIPLLFVVIGCCMTIFFLNLYKNS